MPGFLPRLFGHTGSGEPEPRECDEAGQPCRVRTPRFPRGFDSGLRSLWSEVGHLSHSEFPFLHADYSPGSRVPCGDFTGYIIGQLSVGELGPIENLLRSLLAANPGLGTDDGWIIDEIEEVVSLDFDRYLSSGESSTVHRELTALFLLASKDGGGREFWVTGEIPEVLAAALSCHDLSWKPTMATLRDRANRFIRDMRKDTPYWEEFPLYPEIDLDGWSQPATPLGVRLQSLPPLTRAHVLNLAEKGRGSLLNDTTYPQRNLGLAPAESATLILASGICEPLVDAKALVSSWTKVELCEIFDERGVDYTQSWSKSRLLDLLNRELPDVVEQASQTAMVVQIREELLGQLQAIKQRAEALRKPLDLLCFAGPGK